MKQLAEHKTIAGEEKILLTRCRTAIESIDASAEVILYGSRARGDGEAESDYDLLIITDGEVTLKREDVFRRQLFPIEIETGAVLTVILVSRKDWNSALYGAMPFHQNVERDGIVL
ncbi:MAG: nucleotidyltransferase domain-containing protein [Desulfobacterales bacterium]|nr:nucleotidyltransferase domain-containing protein [Desulfobacterales bacterium]